MQRINAYFNNITNLQGSFEQVDSTNKTTTGRFYVQRPGKIRFDYAPPSALRIIADGKFLAIEDSDLKTVEKYPIQSTPVQAAAGRCGRSRIAMPASSGLRARRERCRSRSKTSRVTPPAPSGWCSTARPELQLKEWMITDAQGLTTRVTVNDVVSGRKVAADFFTSKENFQPFR